jgi:hypothetical protein
LPWAQEVPSSNLGAPTKNISRVFFNLGILALTPGVYIVLHREVFSIRRVRKDHASPRFVGSLLLKGTPGHERQGAPAARVVPGLSG